MTFYLSMQLLSRQFKRYSQVKVVYTSCNSIYLNLAAEEYMFEGALEQPVLFLWRNEPTVVIGRHQNPFKECRLQEMKEDGVLLSRRKSGGGAVFHSLGNTCFSFLTPYGAGQLLNYKQVNFGIVIKALADLGVVAEQSGRNDLCVDGFKVSGSAFKIKPGGVSTPRVLHHGTLLIDVPVASIQRYLNPNKLKLVSKGIDSVAARVKNLKQLSADITHEAICSRLQRQFAQHYGLPLVKEQWGEQTVELRRQVEEYKSWDWLYGKTPEFTHQFTKKFDWGLVELNLRVDDCIIKDCRIYTDCLLPDLIERLQHRLLGQPYSPVLHTALVLDCASAEEQAVLRDILALIQEKLA